MEEIHPYTPENPYASDDGFTFYGSRVHVTGSDDELAQIAREGVVRLGRLRTIIESEQPVHERHHPQDDDPTVAPSRYGRRVWIDEPRDQNYLTVSLPERAQLHRDGHTAILYNTFEDGEPVPIHPHR